VARIRDVKKNRTLAQRATPRVTAPPAPTTRRLFKPESAERAEMLNGTSDEIARQVVTILERRGLLT
jgi:hypothetical protein